MGTGDRKAVIDYDLPPTAIEVQSHDIFASVGGHRSAELFVERVNLVSEHLLLSVCSQVHGVRVQPDRGRVQLERCQRISSSPLSNPMPHLALSQLCESSTSKGQCLSYRPLGLKTGVQQDLREPSPGKIGVDKVTSSDLGYHYTRWYNTRASGKEFRLT